MTLKNLTALCVSIALLPALSACSPISTAAGVGVGVGQAAASERGVEGAAIDTRIQAQINELWFRKDLEMFQKLNLTVENQKVLVTGVVQKPEHRVEAVRLIWQVNGVKEVINEVKVANSEGIKGYVRDAWISNALRTKLLFDRDIHSVNYSVDTVQGIVYLMGVAQNQRELNKVLYHARNTDYVRNVVNYTSMLGDLAAAKQRESDMKRQQLKPRSLTPATSQAQNNSTARYPTQQQSIYNPAPDYDTPVESTPLPATGGAKASGGKPAPIVDQGF